MKHARRLVAAALLGMAATALAQPVAFHTRQGAKFEDVRDDLKAAIESRGFVVDYHAHIARMLERTGKDVGSTRAIYADAEAFQFCSAALSRRMMEADPANVAMCPYTLVVYALAGQPGQVTVAFRRPVREGASAASAAVLREVDAVLDAIAREATGRK